LIFSFDVAEIRAECFWSDRSNNQCSKSTFYDEILNLEIAMNESATILTSDSSQAEEGRQAGAESLNGNGFYRFKIGDLQATVISDGYGPIPVGPIFAMNVSEAELAPVLKANFMPPVIQVTNNILVVDTGRERILFDTGFGEKIGPPFGNFPGLEANLRRDIRRPMPPSCSPRTRNSSCIWVTSPITR